MQETKVTVAQYSMCADDYARFKLYHSRDQYLCDSYSNILLNLPKEEARIFGVDLENPNWRYEFKDVLLDYNSLYTLMDLYRVDNFSPSNVRNRARVLALKFLLDGESVVPEISELKDWCHRTKPKS